MSWYNQQTSYDGEHPDPPQDQTSEPQPELKFFMFSDPAEAKSPGNKKLVRSHVARTSHAKHRHAKSSGSTARSTSNTDMENLHYQSASRDSVTMESSWALDGSAGSSSIAYNSNLPLSSASAGYQNLGDQVVSESFPGPMTPWEQYLLDHYVNVLIPSRHNPCDHPRHSIDVDLYRQGMTTHWVNFCLTDSGLVQGIYFASCRDLSKMQRKSGNKKDAEMYEQRALHYKGECLRLASEAMPQDGRPVNDNVIGMTLVLAFNEYAAGDYQQATQHMAACEYMIDVKGGHQTLGLDGFLSQLVVWFKEELSMASTTSGKFKGKKKAHS